MIRPAGTDALAHRTAGSWPQTLTLAAGVLAGGAAIAGYAVAGYRLSVLGLWLAALVLLGIGFAVSSGSLALPALADVVVPAVVVAALSPLYVVGLHAWPVQVGSDEVAIMTYADRWGERSDPDLFGLTDYLGHPALLFVALGKLGTALGGVELTHMRLVHALLGLLTVAAAYAFLRQLLPRPWAGLAALLLGVNHSLFMLSRMAMRENTSVLVETTALALLLLGLRRNHPAASFGGGVAAGLGFYVYFPGRATIVVWVLFLVALAVRHRAELPLRRLGALAAATLCGFVLMAGPVIVAGAQAPPEVNEQQRLALMIFPEARELQRDWVFDDSVFDGYVNNVWLGLSAFNNLVQDHAFNYPNRGHGFLDPITGVLLWVGVAVVGWSTLRRRAPLWALLPLVGLISLWLAFAFLVNKAPNYPRLLITLPFVAYFAVEGLRWLAEAAGRRWSSRAVPFVAGAAVAAVAAANLAIAWDFVDDGRRRGDDIGSTGRLVESLRDRPGQRFYIAASEALPYYAWGYPHRYAERVRIFARDDAQFAGVVDVQELDDFDRPPPFALFMSRRTWKTEAPALERRYPGAVLRRVTPDGRLVALVAA